MKRITIRQSYYSRKKRRKVKIPCLKKRILGDLILFLILFLSLFYFLFFSPFFKIKEMKISGGDIKSASFSTRLLIEKMGKNIFLFSVSKIEKEILKNCPNLKKAELHRKWPAGLVLTLEKRQPIALFCLPSEPDNCLFFIDEEGIVFEKGKNDQEGDLLKIFSGSNNGKIEEIAPGEMVLSQEKIKQIVEISEGVKKVLKTNSCLKVFLGEGERVDLETEEGWKIYFDLSVDSKISLTKLKLLLGKEITPEKRVNLEYIDLRFSKAYYKLRERE